MITTPLLKNDYLTAATIASTLFVAQPASYVNEYNHLKPTLNFNQVNITAGTAWVTGTLVTSTTDEIVVLPTDAKNRDKRLIVLSVSFDGETQPSLKTVNHSYFASNTAGGWYHKPGERVDFPIALVEKQFYGWKMTDVRLASSAGLFAYYGSPEMAEVYAAPIGTLYRGNDDLFYIQAFIGGSRFTAPDNPDVFRKFSPATVQAQKNKNGIDIGGVSYTQTTHTIRAVGRILIKGATGNEIVWNLKPQATRVRIGTTDRDEPIFLNYETFENVLAYRIVDKNNNPPKGEYIELGFETLGGISNDV